MADIRQTIKEQAEQLESLRALLDAQLEINKAAGDQAKSSAEIKTIIAQLTASQKELGKLTAKSASDEAKKAKATAEVNDELSRAKVELLKVQKIEREQLVLLRQQRLARKEVSEEDRKAAKDRASAKRAEIKLEKEHEAAIKENARRVKAEQDQLESRNKSRGGMTMYGRTLAGMKERKEERSKSATGSQMSSASNTMVQGLLGAGGGVPGAIDKVLGGITSLIPATGAIGGLVGLMIAGVKRDAEFAAIGQQAEQMFDSVAKPARGFGSTVASLSRSLSVAGIASKEAFAKVAGAMRDASVTAKEAGAAYGVITEKQGGLMRATLMLDKEMEQQEGHFAAMAGQISKSFNVSLTNAFTTIVKFRSQLKGANVDFNGLISKALEAGAAMKMLNVNFESVIQSQAMMLGGMQKQGFSTAFSQEYAGAGARSVGGAVANMQEGLAAIIGERVLNKGGGGPSGIEALYQMKSGIAGGKDQRDLFAGTIKELYKLTTEMGAKTRGERALALTKVAGVDYAGADLILELGDKLGKGQEATPEEIKKMSEALMTAGEIEAKKTSAMQRALQNIEDGILHVMTGILGLLVSAVRGLGASITLGLKKVELAATFNPEDKKRIMGEIGVAQAESDAARSGVSKNIDRILAGGHQAWGGLKDGASLFLKAGSLSDEERKQAYVRGQQGWNPNMGKAANEMALDSRNIKTTRTQLPGGGQTTSYYYDENNNDMYDAGELLESAADKLKNAGRHAAMMERVKAERERVNSKAVKTGE